MLATAVTRKAGMVLALILVVVGAAACSSSPSTKAPSPSKGSSGHFLTTTLSGAKTRYGTVVVRIFGYVAYANKNEGNGKITCRASCTKTWKPWLTGGRAPRAGKGLKQTLVGTITRPGGTKQVTYGGHPLYLYARTTTPLQANAQGAGGVWYVVNVTGQLVT